MSGIRSGSRLDQLLELQRATRVHLEHARRTQRPDRTDLEQLAAAVSHHIALEQRALRARPEVAAAVRQADNAVTQLLNELGTTAHDVKVWCVAHGLLDQVLRGRIALRYVQAYATAHHPQETP